MSNTPTRDSIERALALAGERGLIKSWMRLPGYGPHAKWLVSLLPGAVVDGSGDVELRTYAEAKLVCGALASAWTRTQKSLDEAAEIIARYREAFGELDAEYYAGESDGIPEGCEI